jgi:hypothetical protein
MAIAHEPEQIDENNLPRPYEDVRQWLELVEQMGELKRIDGADWNLGIGTMAELIYRERAGTIPALLFDRIRIPAGHQSCSASRRLVAFGPDGRLADGQCRLEAGQPFQG